MKPLHSIMIALFLMIILLLPTTCLAMTQSEWNEECRTKTSGTTTLYSLEKNGESVELIEIGSLPGGTHFKTGEFDYDLRMWHITYFTNGQKGTGWIHRENLVMATKEVFLNDGSAIIVTEAVYKNKAALQKEINRLAPGRSLYGDGSKPIAADGALPPEDVVNDPEALRQWADDYAKDRANTPTRADNKGTTSTSHTTISNETAPVIQWTPKEELSDEERAFIADCSQQVNRTVTVYSDATMTKASGTIKGGTLCKLIDESGEVARISYYENGTAQTAYIKRSDLYGAYTQYRQEDGTINTVYLGDPDYAKILEGKEITYLAESLQKGIEEDTDETTAVAVQLLHMGSSS